MRDLSPAYSFFPKFTPGLALGVVLVNICLQAQASAFRDGPHHLPSLKEERSGRERGEISMVQSSLRSVQRHSSSAGEQCFFEDTSDTASITSILNVLTISECQKSCQETDFCTHFVFNSKNHECYHKLGAYSWRPSTGEFAGTRRCKLPANVDSLGERCYKENVGSTTPEIKVVTVESGDSFEGLKECQGHCLALKDCTHVTYNGRSKKCFMKSGSPTWRTYTGDWSASRDCSLDGEKCLKKNVGSTTASMKETEAVTVEACQELCRSTVGCTHFTFSAKTNMCYVKAGKPQWREVWLDFSASTNCDFSGDQDVSVCLKAGLGSITPEIGKRNLAAFHRAGAYLECQKACRETPTCTHITYNDTSKVCYLKAGSPTWRPYEEDVSSGRDCGVPKRDCFFDDYVSVAKTIKTHTVKVGTTFTSALACRELCRVTSGCTHVSYDGSKHACELKEGEIKWNSSLVGNFISMAAHCN